jgi:hypothetical protein
LNRREGEIGNPLKRADICARFFQPIHQRHEVVAAGSQTSPRMDPQLLRAFSQAFGVWLGCAPLARDSSRPTWTSGMAAAIPEAMALMRGSMVITDLPVVARCSLQYGITFWGLSPPHHGMQR